MSDKRGYKAALAGLVLQAVLIAVVAAMRAMSASPPLRPAMWLMVAPAAVWLLTAVLFYSRFLARREGEQLDQLSQQAGGEGLFTPDEYARPAEKRLAWMVRYLVPTFTLAMAIYHGLVAVLLLGWLSGAEALAAKAPVAIFLCAGAGFAGLLLSRYTLGMSKVEAWRLLRAPGSYMFADVLVFMVLAIALAAEMAGMVLPSKIAAYVLTALLALLGVEMLLNFVLDLYRPRVPGAEVRYAHDSRLLETLASPERIGHSISEALNYQFGFEVSKSWFYKLLSRAMVPLLMSAALILWLLTGVVVVEEGQEVVVLHWGTPRDETLKPRPSPYLVWPWPIDTVHRFNTGEVRMLELGVGAERDEDVGVVVKNGERHHIYLWTAEHGLRKEMDTLVARPAAGRTSEGKQIPSVDIVKVVATLYYRVDAPLRWSYAFVNPEKLLENIAYREMTIYAASATLDEPLPAGANRPARIMSSGRSDFQDALAKRITDRAAERNLGVKIMDVALVGVHPPPEAAPAFEKVIAAEREQDKLRYAAQADANTMLVMAAGETERALRLAQAIVFLQDFEKVLNRRRTGGDVKEAIDAAIAASSNEIEKLRQEIDLYRLGGLDAAESEATSRRLLDAYNAHVKTLQDVAAALETADVQSLATAAREKVETEFAAVQGAAALEIARARADRWKTELRERALAETFNVELMGLRAAPNVYTRLKLLDVLAEGLKDKPKTVLAVDPDKVEVRLDLREQSNVLEDVTFGESR